MYLFTSVRDEKKLLHGFDAEENPSCRRLNLQSFRALQVTVVDIDF